MRRHVARLATRPTSGCSPDGTKRNPGLSRMSQRLCAAPPGRSERLAHALRVACDDGQVCARRLIRFDSPLFPITEGSDWNAISLRKVLLTQAEGATNDLR